jgi:hypothetical protein
LCPSLTDQDQHDQTHTLLAVIGAVEKLTTTSLQLGLCGAARHSQDGPIKSTDVRLAQVSYAPLDSDQIPQHASVERSPASTRGLRIDATLFKDGTVFFQNFLPSEPRHRTESPITKRVHGCLLVDFDRLHHAHIFVVHHVTVQHEVPAYSRKRLRKVSVPPLRSTIAVSHHCGMTSDFPFGLTMTNELVWMWNT